MATDDDDDTGSTGGRTYTQADVDRIVRDRLARERSKYADYDDLKAKAADADKSKSQLDKMQEQLNAMSERAEKGEREALIREVADDLKISVKQAKRLTGKTKEELLADGREFLEEFKPARRKSSDKNGKNGDDGARDETDGDEDDDDDEDGEGSTDTGSTGDRGSRGRPRETLRSGAAMTSRKPEETDPLKLAELIPRR